MDRVEPEVGELSYKKEWARVIQILLRRFWRTITNRSRRMR